MGTLCCCSVAEKVPVENRKTPNKGQGTGKTKMFENQQNETFKGPQFGRPSARHQSERKFYVGISLDFQIESLAIDRILVCPIDVASSSLALSSPLSSCCSLKDGIPGLAVSSDSISWSLFGIS